MKKYLVIEVEGDEFGRYEITPADVFNFIDKYSTAYKKAEEKNPTIDLITYILLNQLFLNFR